MNELNGKGLPQYSELGFGEALSKVARHELAILCLEGIRLELSNRPIRVKSRGRGRPPSPIGILALRMGVHPDSVRRWTALREVQASDYNSEKLAIMAYKYSPEGVARILRKDVGRYRETMEAWLRQAEANYAVSPYPINSGEVFCPYCPDSFPDQEDLVAHIISLHTGTLAKEVGTIKEEEVMD